jgi:hypothetical protein
MIYWPKWILSQKCNNFFRRHYNTKIKWAATSSSSLLVGALRHRKKANFTRRQNVLLIVRSHFLSVALQLWRTLAGWAAAAGSLSRLHQTVLGWHVVSTSNPTAAFSAFQTVLYSSNYSVYPITRLSGPRPRPNSLRKILRSDRESNPGPLCL